MKGTFAQLSLSQREAKTLGLWLPVASITLQFSQPLLRILKLCYARVSVFPEVEEFLVVFDSFSIVALLLILLILIPDSSS
jgi:hypothetical protein